MYCVRSKHWPSVRELNTLHDYIKVATEYALS